MKFQIYLPMFKLLLDLCFPPLCQACNKVLCDNKFVICTACRHHLPLAFSSCLEHDLHHDILKGIELRSICALFFFQKGGLVQQLLHHLKYKNQQKIGIVLGQWLGSEMLASGQWGAIDLVIPIPIHSKRLRQRGYNQVQKFAKEIACQIGAKFETGILKKIRHTKTQVFQSKAERWKSVEHSFILTAPDAVYAQNILIVDDIITTGATINACVSVLQMGQPKSTSVATIAIAAERFR